MWSETESYLVAIAYNWSLNSLYPSHPDRKNLEAFFKEHYIKIFESAELLNEKSLTHLVRNNKDLIVELLKEKSKNS